MFGRREDGRRLKLDDPIVGLTPYVMPKRDDSQVMVTQHIDCDTLTNFIRAKREENIHISYMDLIIAAYVRTASRYPEMNRFIMNKKVFARNHIAVSLAVLKTLEGDDIQETTIKVKLAPESTLVDVHNAFAAAIEENRKPAASNLTDKVAMLLLGTPGLATLVVALARFMDNHGILPHVILEASPFHTSMFITNMASIGMPSVYHHIYNFGTTSIFVGMGRIERHVEPAPGGTMRFRRMIPLGVVIDERIACGAQYGRAFSYLRELLANPEMLMSPPEEVKTEI